MKLKKLLIFSFILAGLASCVDVNAYRGYWGGGWGWGWGWGYPYGFYGWGWPYYGYGWGYPYVGVTYSSRVHHKRLDDAGYDHWVIINETNNLIHVSAPKSNRVKIAPGERARLYHPRGFRFKVEGPAQRINFESKSHVIRIKEDANGYYLSLGAERRENYNPDYPARYRTDRSGR